MSAIQDLPTGLTPFDTFARWLNRVTMLFSALGTMLILGIMLLISFDVIGRFFFGNPIAGVPETMARIDIVFLQIANTTAEGKLTRSDALLGALHRRSPRLAEGFDALLHLAGAALLAILLSAFYPQYLRSYGRGEMIGTVGQFLAPIWPVHGIVLLGSGLLFMVFVVRALALAIRAIRGQSRRGTP